LLFDLLITFGSHSLFLCGKPKWKQQMVFGLWFLHLVVTSYDYFLTNWLLILLNGKNILFNKIDRGFEWKKFFVHGEYGMEVKSHKDPISYAKIIVQLFLNFFHFFFVLFQGLIFFSLVNALSGFCNCNFHLLFFFGGFNVIFWFVVYVGTIKLTNIWKTKFNNP